MRTELQGNDLEQHLTQSDGRYTGYDDDCSHCLRLQTNIGSIDKIEISSWDSSGPPCLSNVAEIIVDECNQVPD